MAIAVENHPSLKAAGCVGAGRPAARMAGERHLPAADQRRPTRRTGATPASSARTGSSGNAVTNQSQTFNFYNTGVSFTQVLFDFGQTLAVDPLRAGDRTIAARRTARPSAIPWCSTSSSRTSTSWRHAACWRVADETVRQNQKHLEQAQGRFDVGLAPKFDVTQAQVQLANAELNQVTARNNRGGGARDLAQRARDHRPARLRHRRHLRLAHRADRRRRGAGDGLRQRPELQSIRAQEVGHERADRRLAAELPAQRERQRRLPLDRERLSACRSNWDIGAAVNLSIFNGGLTTAQVGEAKANLANLKFNEEVLRQNIALEVRQAVTQPAAGRREHPRRREGAAAGAREPGAGGGTLQHGRRQHHRADRRAGLTDHGRGQPRAGAVYLQDDGGRGGEGHGQAADVRVMMTTLRITATALPIVTASWRGRETTDLYDALSGRGGVLLCAITALAACSLGVERRRRNSRRHEAGRAGQRRDRRCSKDVPVQLRAIGTVEAVLDGVDQVAGRRAARGGPLPRGAGGAARAICCSPSIRGPFEAALRQAEANLARDRAEARERRSRGAAPRHAAGAGHRLARRVRPGADPAPRRCAPR